MKPFHLHTSPPSRFDLALFSVCFPLMVLALLLAFGAALYLLAAVIAGAIA